MWIDIQLFSSRETLQIYIQIPLKNGKHLFHLDCYIFFKFSIWLTRWDSIIMVNLSFGIQRTRNMWYRYSASRTCLITCSNIKKQHENTISDFEYSIWCKIVVNFTLLISRRSRPLTTGWKLNVKIIETALVMTHISSYQKIYLIFSLVTDYLLEHMNTTIHFECFPSGMFSECFFVGQVNLTRDPQVFRSNFEKIKKSVFIEMISCVD